MRLQILGPLRLGAEQGEDLLPSEKAKCLLAYLSRTRRHEASRDELVALLWPEAEAKRAYGSLRQAIRSIRMLQSRHDCDILDAGQHLVRLDPAQLRTDLDDLLLAIAAGDRTEIDRATSLWADDLFGTGRSAGEDFDTWRETEASTIRSDVVDAAVDRLGREQLFESDPPTAKSLCRFILRVEPAHEDAHVQLIAQYIRTGDRWAALDQFRRHQDIFRTELNLPPTEEAVQLIESLKPSPTSPLGAIPIGRPSLLIETSAVARGLQLAIERSREELTHRLTAFTHLSLRLPIGGGEIRPGIAGTEWKSKLSVDNRPGADFLLRLKPSTDERHILIEILDQVSGGLLLHDRISVSDLEGRQDFDAIFGRSSARIERAVVNRVLEGQEMRDTVFARWARAVDLIKNFDPASIDEACAILKGTITSVSKSFAPAHAAMASAILTRRLYRPDGDKGADLRDARQRIETALRIDPWDTYSHRIAGWTSYQNRDFDSGLKHFSMSIELNSSDPYVHIAAAEAFAYAGRIGEAKKHAEIGFRMLKPVPPYFYSYLATIFFVVGDYAECVAFCERGPVQSDEVLVLKAAALGLLGETEQAAKAIGAVRDAGAHKNDQAICDWLAETNMYRDPQTRHNYVSGLEAAGLRTIRQSFGARL